MIYSITNRQAKLACRVVLLVIAAMAASSFGFRKLTHSPLPTTSFNQVPQTSHPLATIGQYSSTDRVSKASVKMSSITHIVLFQFKPEVSPETIIDVQQPFYSSSIQAGHLSDPKCHRFASRCSRSRKGACPPLLTSHTSNQLWVVWTIAPRVIKYENPLALSMLPHLPC